MKNRIFLILALLVLAGLSTSLGCATSPAIRPVNAGPEVGDYVVAEPYVKAADWDKMETVEVVLSEYSFDQSEFHFKAESPYKLQIKNKGAYKHYFVAEEFFKAIATRKVQSNKDGEIKAPYFTAIEVYPGGSLDLYFVAVTKGEYNLHCTIEGHEAMGMHGTIIIE